MLGFPTLDIGVRLFGGAQHFLIRLNHKKQHTIAHYNWIVCVWRIAIYKISMDFTHCFVIRNVSMRLGVFCVLCSDLLYLKCVVLHACSYYIFLLFCLIWIPRTRYTLIYIVITTNTYLFEFTLRMRSKLISAGYTISQQRVIRVALYAFSGSGYLNCCKIANDETI